MAKTINIAIDGPSGAGKSTVARSLAKRMGYVYLDTGAMYRALALKADRAGLTPADDLTDVLDGTDISVGYRRGEMRVFLDGADVSEAIRQHRMSELASAFSAVKAVRLKLVDIQRKLAAEQDTVLDGRDIGTFVLPDADFKFYLTASAEARARRRSRELKRRGQAVSFEQLLADIRARDERDMNREFAPLRKADDAVEIDSTLLSVDEVLADMMDVILGR